MKSNYINKVLPAAVMVFFAVFFCVNSLYAASAVLSWDPPATNADGTELTDLAGYKVYYGTESGSYPESIDVGNVVSYEISNLSEGTTYYFAATAYDTAGNESLYSDEVSKTVSGADTTSVDYYCDSDGDGYIDTSIDGSCTGTGCEPAGCQTAPGDDCNDSDQSVNPGVIDSTCDGIDDDCDGTADNDYVATPTTCGVGVCAATGELSCSNGMVVDTCTAGAPTGDDADCNGIDENCDGVADDNYVTSVVSCGTGVCSSVGQLECLEGVEVDSCTPGTPAEDPEATCGDDLDNDCDGLVDEECFPEIEAGSVLIYEDFSAGIPAEWSVEGGWNTADECGREVGSPFEGAYAIVDSSCAVTGYEELVTPAFDALSCNTVTLDFTNQYYWYSGSADVNVSGDGGAVWENSFSASADDGYPVPGWKEIDISSAAGSDGALISFGYTSDAPDGYWALDNVWVTCQSDRVPFTARIQETAQETLMVTNRGEGDLVIDTVNITGTDASEFSIAENEGCTGLTLAPGGSCTVDILFAPLSAGTKSAEMIISSNDPVTPSLNVILAGTGEDTTVLPVPGISVNGSYDNVDVIRGDDITSVIELDPGSLSGTDADWWLLMNYNDRWYSYDESRGKWSRGVTVYRQGQITKMSETEIFNSSKSFRGGYTLYFGVDTMMNGVMDTDIFYSDSIIVNIY